jgi:O-antigen ligase
MARAQVDRAEWEIPVWGNRAPAIVRPPAGPAPGIGPPPAGPAAATGRSDQLVLWLVSFAIGFVALLNPKLPGHSAPADVLMIGCLAVVFLWNLSRRARWQLPYAVGVTGLLLTGLLAASLSAYPRQGLTAVLQEIYLFLWCAAVATVIRSAQDLAVVLRTWALSAVGWGALLVVAVAGHLKAISGTGDRLLPGSSVLQSGGGFRSRLFFDHPNMAGNYFMIAVFVLIASGYPRRRWLRYLCCLVLVAAMFMSGSNAALVSLIGGGLLTALLSIKARSGLVKATAVISVVGLVLGAVAVLVVPPVLDAAAQSSVGLIHDTLGRSNRSAEKRQSLFDSQLVLYSEGNLVGIGPNGTQELLNKRAAAEVKEAHNDYLGTLVERGPFGLLALFALIGGALARCVSFSGRPLPPRVLAAVPVPAALAGACLAFAITAFTHEVLHYRWLWTLLGVVAALHLLLRREPDVAAPVGTAAAPRPEEA